MTNFVNIHINLCHHRSDLAKLIINNTCQTPFTKRQDSLVTSSPYPKIKKTRNYSDIYSPKLGK